MSAKTIGIILLAAGASKRLGQPKQLLAYGNQSFLQYSLQTAIASKAFSVVVVLGAQAQIIQEKIKETTAHIVVNNNWTEGMASSIRCGIDFFNKVHPSADGVILMMCDQPFVTAALLNQIVEAYQKGEKRIVTCGYDNTFGPPVFFHRSLFPELLQLKGDVGARSIVRKYIDDVEVIPFPEGTFDIDTKRDYERLAEK